MVRVAQPLYFRAAAPGTGAVVGDEDPGRLSTGKLAIRDARVIG